MKLLPASFTDRDATVVAPELLNKLLVIHGQVARITEVEAYTRDDAASHSHRGMTKRNAVMFGPSGHLYVYFIYGMHHCINVVTGVEGDGQAVLIRAATIDGVLPRASSGPGRLARVLGVDLMANGVAAMVYDDGTAPPRAPIITPRIGIAKAADLRRRWVLP